MFLTLLTTMLPHYSSSDDVYAQFPAPFIMELSIINVTGIGLGIVKDEGVLNSMTRHGTRM